MMQLPIYPARENFDNDLAWARALEVYEFELSKFEALQEDAGEVRIDMARFDASFNQFFPSPKA